jgi:hypothetical protein
MINVERVAALINEAVSRNSDLQKTFVVGTVQWHSCETVDDRLFEALAELEYFSDDDSF